MGNYIGQNTKKLLVICAAGICVFYGIKGVDNMIKQPLMTFMHQHPFWSSGLELPFKGWDMSDAREYQEWLRQQTARKTRIAATCSKYGQSVHPTPERNNFIYDSEHSLLFCRHAKVASTTWLSYFLSLSNVEVEHRNTTEIMTQKQKQVFLQLSLPFILRVTDSDPDIRTLAESTVSFSMVRHPFERLTSAYQDKVVDDGQRGIVGFQVRDWMHENYGNLSFSNFLRTVLHFGSFQCSSIQNCEEMNVHWRPYISRCAYCDVPYTVIVRSETFDTDVKFLSRLSGVTFPQHQANHTSSGGSTKDLARKYFSQVSPGLVRRIYNLYEKDFEMFDYSAQEYFEASSQNEKKVKANV